MKTGGIVLRILKPAQRSDDKVSFAFILRSRPFHFFRRVAAITKKGKSMENKIREILEFWLGEDPYQPLKNQEKWWKKDSTWDEEIRHRFLRDWERARSGDYDVWKQSALGCLAWILLLDQFSRNLYRDSPQAFAQDPLALQACLDGLHQGLDTQLQAIQKVFFYLPLMHSESLSHQHRSVALFRQLLAEAPQDLTPSLQNSFEFALRHAEIIQRFGRFPHRNAILGRQSSEAEILFLQEPHSSF